MKKLGFILALGLATAACGDDSGTTKDASNPDTNNPGQDTMMPDAPMAATFTSFVIDLVKNHTTSTEAPQPYSAFSSLPDPDGNCSTVNLP